MFTRDHLLIGAGAFILGAVVATGSIMAVLSLQSGHHEAAVVAPTAALPAPQAAATVTPAAPASQTPPPQTVAVPPASPKPLAAPAPTHVAVAKPVESPAKPPVNPHPAHAKPSPKPQGLAGEEADRVAIDSEQLEKKKKNLQSQLADSEELIKLKEQQIKALEARLNAPASH